MCGKNSKVGVLMLAAGGLLVLSGCAGLSKLGESSVSDKTDWTSVSEINRISRDRGVDVIWINMPKKKRDDTQK